MSDARLRETSVGMGELALDYDPGKPVRSVVVPSGDTMWLVTGHALGRLVLADQRFSRALGRAGPSRPSPGDAHRPDWRHRC
ncbi:MAG: hypothetical protein ACRDRD_07815 [Pseudonocardiaceae bacterium]